MGAGLQRLQCVGVIEMNHPVELSGEIAVEIVAHLFRLGPVDHPYCPLQER